MLPDCVYVKVFVCVLVCICVTGTFRVDEKRHSTECLDSIYIYLYGVVASLSPAWILIDFVL